MTQPANKSRAWGLLVTAALWPALGLAQPVVGGNGIKVGEGRLHPTFDFETRLDSAAGYFPSRDNPSELSSALSGEALLHFRPGIRLELPSSRKLGVNLVSYLDYVHYTGLITPGSTNASRLQGLADLNLSFNKGGVVGVELTDHFERSDRTQSVAMGVGVLSLFNQVRLGVPLRPGGGALEVTPEVGWAMERFQPLSSQPASGCVGLACDPSTVSRFDYHDLHTSLQGRWRFLPKTAVVVDTRLNYRGYTSEGEGTRDALVLHTAAGLAGLVSPKIAVTAKLGWAQDFKAEQAGGALTAQVDGTWMLRPTANLKLGYVRTLEPVAAYGLFRDDRVFLEGQMLLGGRLTLRGASAFDYLSFQEPRRRDRIFRLDMGPEYQFQRWLSGGAGYLLSLRSSTDAGAGNNFTRHEGYVRMTVTY